MRPLFLAIAVLFALPASAQKAAPALRAASRTAEDCATGTAESDLDVGGVRARLYNIGGLFWRGSGSVYEVPARSGKNAVFSAALWIGGMVNDTLRFAGSTYGPWEFWPGPLDAIGETSSETCAAFDRIWSVTTSDLSVYDRTGVATSDLEDWPIGVGAPFFADLDGDRRQGDNEPTVTLDLEDAGYGTRRLDLKGGERPVIFGRQTAWWVMNDMGGAHDWSEEEPLGVEVRVTAWTLGDLDAPDLLYSTFYRYEIINRSADVLEDVYVGMHVDADLGDATDDYVGSDPTRGMVFFYNGDNNDDGQGGYGVPPALGIDVLSGALGGMNVRKSTLSPSNGAGAYNYLRGIWPDGTPLKVGGDGYNTNGPVTRWTFSGDPPAFWSEYNSDGNGIQNVPGDRRAMVSAIPFQLEPRERHTVDIGFLFAQGADNLDSVRELKRISDVAQVAFEDGTLFSRREAPPPPSSAPTLISPADGAAFEEETVTFQWTSVPDATGYRLELASSESFEDAIEYLIDSTSVVVPRASFPNNTAAPVFWRVTASTLEVEGPTSETRSLTNFVFFGRITLIEVVANAAGPIVPPTGGAADFAGFPVPRSPGAEQQVSDAVWLLDAGSSLGTFESFQQRAILTRSPENAERIDSYDFEARFTGPSMAYRRFQDLTLVEIPFEIWNIGRGTPDDPSDDFRMVPAILDYTPPDSDVANGIYDLSTSDSPVSDLEDDPYTDWVYWYEPNDKTPGESGYQAWLANATAAPTDHGGEVLARTVFVGWDLGTAAPYAEPYPEPGTVFRITTLKRFNVAADDTPSRSAFSLEVYPNPTSTRAEIAFALEAAGRVRLAVYDVLGREVSVLEDGPMIAGEHRAGLEVGRLAPGVYVVVLEGAGERASRTVTVVR